MHDTTVIGRGTIRLGVVSFLNARPLIDGLEALEGFELRLAPPSHLLDGLLAGEHDVALCSSIDFQRSPTPLTILPCGILGCDGETLTVRLYSQVPIHRIDEVHCDQDSHTSIALMQILLRETHDIDPRIVPYDARERMAGNQPLEWPQSMLLIGDKVVTDSPPAVRYPHQIDLGALWARHTGLPFVFATWMTGEDVREDVARSAMMVLDHQRRYNHMHLDAIIEREAPARGWPCDLARTYLREYLTFAWSTSRQQGLEHFFARAHEHGLLGSQPLRPLALLS
ncbi:MAG: menaquinone biosynthetic enzyme MqnA/MqnD family protein [Phycisphaerales bacterium]